VSAPAALTGLREVRDADSAALIDLIGTTWAEYPGVYLQIDAEEPWLRAPATYYAKAGAGARMWVVDDPDRGALAACVGMRPVSAAAVELKSLYVAAWARRRGLGAALVGLVERSAVELGAHRIELWSDTRFADAHHLYARLGYTQRGSRELHDLSETTEYGFTRDLDIDRMS
jgi:N-acetylglutamate synthase-like GNAT family acetyltransferase